jgi:hypothetical protein
VKNKPEDEEEDLIKGSSKDTIAKAPKQALLESGYVLSVSLILVIFGNL